MVMDPSRPGRREADGKYYLKHTTIASCLF
jgi:hypothetical protein